jgi:hypothetical protein
MILLRGRQFSCPRLQSIHRENSATTQSAERSFNRIEAGQANRGGAAGEVGEGQGGAEEVGVEATEPAAKMRRAFSSASRNLSRENWNSQLWF